MFDSDTLFITDTMFVMEEIRTMSIEEMLHSRLPFLTWAGGRRHRWYILPLDHPDILAECEAFVRDDMMETGRPLGWFYVWTVEGVGGLCQHEFWRPLRPCAENPSDYARGSLYHYQLNGQSHGNCWTEAPETSTSSVAGIRFTLQEVFVTKRVMCLFKFSEVQKALAHHVQGDWDGIGIENWQENEHNLQSGGVLVSRFSGEADSLFIFTQKDGDTTIWTGQDVSNFEMDRQQAE